MSITRAKLSAFAASGFLAAFAGGLYAYHQQALRADRFQPETSILLFSMVVIGGMGSMSGALLGAVYVRGTQYFLSAQFQLLATGFVSPVQAFGARQLLASQAEEGLLSWEVRSA